MPVDDLAAEDPRKVGRWVLEGRVGLGGIGVVYVGSDRGQRAAVKVADPELAADDSFRTWFTAEVAACSPVTGAQVAEVIDADPGAPQPWLAVELPVGPTLQESVDQGGPMSADELRSLASGVAQGLHQVHESGTTHRNLRPSCVVLTSGGPVLTDVGIGGASKGDAQDASAWIAPEHAEGHSPGPPADVYSWAATVLYAATGRVPSEFASKSASAGTDDAVRAGVARALADVPQDIVGLVLAGLSPDPADRPTLTEVLGTLNPPDAHPHPQGETGEVRCSNGHQLDATAAYCSSCGEPRTLPGTPAEGSSSRSRYLLIGGLVVLVAVVGLTAGAALGIFDRSSEDQTEAAMVDNVTPETSPAPTPPVEPEPPATTTSVDDTEDIRSVDFANRTYDIACGGFEDSAITLVDGDWEHPEGPTRGVITSFEVEYADVTGDGTDEAVVVIGCNIGISTVGGRTFVMTMEDGQVRQVGQTINTFVELVDGQMVSDVPHWLPDDPRCCPSMRDISDWVFSNGGWSQENLRRLGAPLDPF